MHRSLGFGLILVALSSAAPAQRTIVVDPQNNPAVRRGAVVQGQMPPGMTGAVPLSVLQAQFRAQAGGDTVKFGRDDYLLDEAARRSLALQANWLRMNPTIRANIEGHADVRHTRAHALALGERRAAAVHSFLLAQGVAPGQISVSSWGKERPAVDGAHDATWLHNSRVVTMLVSDPAPMPVPGMMPPPIPPGWRR